MAIGLTRLRREHSTFDADSPDYWRVPHIGTTVSMGQPANS